jgi:hypothetical protein
MPKAVPPRAHAVRVDTAIYQQSKSQQAATKIRTALCFHPAVRFLCTALADSPAGSVLSADTRRGVSQERYNFADQQAFAAANAATLDLALVLLFVTSAACPA